MEHYNGRAYVWIVTQCTDGKTAKVVRHSESMGAARHCASILDYGNFEGPVPLDMYPIGKTFRVDGEEVAA